MNKLTIINRGGQLVTDSREVAEMVGIRHDNLLSKIRGYIDILDSSKLRSHDFFVLSSYLNEQNKEQPCFLLTRKGCDMVANKMTGEKGVLFTATYVTKFEEMENKIKGVGISQSDIKMHNFIQAQEYVKNLVNAGIETKKAMEAARELYKAAGIELPKLIEIKYLTVQEIGKALGMYAKKENYVKYIIETLIKNIQLEKGEKKQFHEYKFGGILETKYAESVVKKLEQWLVDNDYPTRFSVNHHDRDYMYQVSYTD